MDEEDDEDVDDDEDEDDVEGKDSPGFLHLFETIETHR